MSVDQRPKTKDYICHPEAVSSFFRKSLLFAITLAFYAITLTPVNADTTTGLVGYWPFESSSNNTTNDLSGNNNTATMFNGPGLIVGKIGLGALQFDGVDDYMTVNASAFPTGVDGNASRTIAGWIKTGNELQSATIFSYGSSSNTFYVSFGGGHGQISTSSGSSFGVYASKNLADNLWHHFVVVHDSTNSSQKIYVDGQLAASGTNAYATKESATPAYIGNRAALNRPFAGSLDDLRIYTRALSASDVTELFNYKQPQVAQAAPAAPAAVNGTCGAAAKNYASSESFPQGAYCTSGTASPATPGALTAGSQTSWVCQGSNGGTNSGTCQATMDAPAPVVSGSTVNLLDGANNTLRTFTGGTAIQACADVAVAGQTCLVNAGTYSGRIIIRNSGNSSNGYIHFAGNPDGPKPVVRGFFADKKNYIKISNFEITHVDNSITEGVYFLGGDHDEILNNTIHHTMGIAIRVGNLGTAGNVSIGRTGNPAALANYAVIKGNAISFSGVVAGYNGFGEGAMLVAGEHHLIEGNDVSHVGDFTNVFGRYNVVRNNYFHDVADSDFPTHPTGTLGHHLDGLQYFSVNVADRQNAGIWEERPYPSEYTLFEGNRIINAPIPHAHAMILRDTNNHGSHDFLMRRNLVVNIGGDGGTANPYDGLRIVHNTYVDVAKDAWNTIFFGNSQSATYPNVDSANGKVFNNIFYNSARDGGGLYSVDSLGSTGFKGDYNLAYRSQGSSAWRSPGAVSYGANDLALQNINPLFVDPDYSDGVYDFSIRINSAYPDKDAVDAGGFLTKTMSSATNSTTMVVEDAGFFFDGYGIENLAADEIQVQNQEASAQIASINYATNTITLKTPLSWSAGAGVTYKYVGNAPDVGAQETQSLNCAASNIRCVGANQEYTTIQSCANAAVAGDTCFVNAGTYNERVAVRNSGTQQNPITFKASGNVVMQGFDISSKPYIIIDGFEITNTAPEVSGIAISSSPGSIARNNHIHHTSGTYGIGISVSTSSTGAQIIGNNVHHTSAIPIRMNGNDGYLSDDVVIKDNIISYGSYPKGHNAGIQIAGKNLLVEGNDISHVGDFVIPGLGDYVVIRNNIFHDVVAADSTLSPHIDAVQAYNAPHILVERNRMYDVAEAGGNVHGFLIGSSANATVRYNTIQSIDGGFFGAQYACKNLRVYNNTAVRTNRATGGGNTAVGFADSSAGSTVLNNLFFDAVTNDYLYHSIYSFTDQSLIDARVDYNLVWDSYCQTKCPTWNLGYPVPKDTDAHGVYNKNPLFKNYIEDTNYAGDDFSLTAQSPAIDAGGALTSVESYNASLAQLVVLDPGFFQSGWAHVEADWIAVGSATNIAQIKSIDEATKTITLVSALPVSVSAGASVWLYKDSSGRQVLYGNKPDIGANEFLQETPVVSPQQSAGSGDVSGDGKVTMYDAALALRYIMTAGGLTDGQIASANMDGNKNNSGKDIIENSDVMAIVRKALGL